MKFVGHSLRPGFDLLIRGEIMPSMSSVFVEEAPSAVVGLLVTVRPCGEAVCRLLQSIAVRVAVRMAIRDFLCSLVCWPHCGG
jgi:hypothetical protein